MDTDRAHLTARPQTSLPRLPWHLASAGIVVFSACAALAAYVIAESQTPGSGLFASVIMILGGLAASLGIGLLGPSTVSVRAIVFSTIGSILLPTLLIGVFVPAYQRGRCGTWIFVAQQFLVSYRQRAFEAVEAGEELPPSIALWVADGEVSDTFFTTPLCGGFSLRDIRIGRWTVADLKTGRVTSAQIVEEAALLPAESWEQIGPFMLCREPAALRSEHPGVIIGFQHEVESGYRDAWAFVFADWSTHRFGAAQLEFVVASNALVRRELGLSAIPEVGPIAIEMARLRAMEAPEE